MCAGSSKPSERNSACISPAPCPSAIRAVAMLDEWISVSTGFSQRRWAWSSLMWNRPIASGAVAS